MEHDEIIGLIKLTVRLEQARPRSFEESEAMRSAHSFHHSGHDSDFDEARAHHEKYRQRGFDGVDLSGACQKELDQSLAWNVFCLERQLDDWFANAHSVPPHCALRVCVLLRKVKRLDLEYEFLRAFIPHYRTPFINKGNDTLIARATKIGARWA
jgi:hypothetical protein